MSKTGTIKLHLTGNKQSKYCSLPLPYRNNDVNKPLIKSVITGIELFFSDDNYIESKIEIKYCELKFLRFGMFQELTENQSLFIPLDNLPITHNAKFSCIIREADCTDVVLHYMNLDDKYEESLKRITREYDYFNSYAMSFINNWIELPYGPSWSSKKICIALKSLENIEVDRLEVIIKHLSRNLMEYSEHKVVIKPRDFKMRGNYHTCELNMSHDLNQEETLISWALFGTPRTMAETETFTINFYYPSTEYVDFNNVGLRCDGTYDKPLDLVITIGSPQPIDNAIAEMKLFE